MQWSKTADLPCLTLISQIGSGVDNDHARRQKRRIIPRQEVHCSLASVEPKWASAKGDRPPGIFFSQKFVVSRRVGLTAKLHCSYKALPPDHKVRLQHGDPSRRILQTTRRSGQCFSFYHKRPLYIDEAGTARLSPTKTGCSPSSGFRVKGSCYLPWIAPTN
jgi:hypothetical protein